MLLGRNAVTRAEPLVQPRTLFEANLTQSSVVCVVVCVQVLSVFVRWRADPLRSSEGEDGC